MILFCVFLVAAIDTGSYPLLLESQDGKFLGDTVVTYYDDRVQKMVHKIALNPCLQRKFFDMCMRSSLDGNNGNTGDETQSSGSLGRLVLICAINQFLMIQIIVIVMSERNKI